MLSLLCKNFILCIYFTSPNVQINRYRCYPWLYEENKIGWTYKLFQKPQSSDLQWLQKPCQLKFRNVIR